MRLVPAEEDVRRRVTVEQAEADYFAEVEEELANLVEKLGRKRRRLRKGLRREAERWLASLQLPFYGSEEWEALKAEMRPGDELWEYCTSRASWQALMGSAGYLLMREGEVVAGVTIRMN